MLLARTETLQFSWCSRITRSEPPIQSKWTYSIPCWTKRISSRMEWASKQFRTGNQLWANLLHRCRTRISLSRTLVRIICPTTKTSTFTIWTTRIRNTKQTSKFRGYRSRFSSSRNEICSWQLPLWQPMKTIELRRCSSTQRQASRNSLLLRPRK